jgi:hypothetical protein
VPDFSTPRNDHQAAMIVLLGGIALLAIVTVAVPSIRRRHRPSQVSVLGARSVDHPIGDSLV